MIRLTNIRPYMIVLVISLLYAAARFSLTIEASRSIGNPNHVDPASLHLRGEFVESNLGSSLNANGSVTIRMIAERYLFVPSRITVPVGVPVRLRITSADVPHAFRVAGVRVKVIPGVVTEVHFQLSSAGDYEVYCEEFCGPGHHAMMERFVAVPQKDFAAQNHLGSGTASQDEVTRGSR